MAEKPAALWILFCLTLAAWEDLRTGKAANGKVLLALPGLIWMHTSWWLPSALIALAAWWMWRRGAWGGADAKWTMLLAFASPTWGLAALLAAVPAALVGKALRRRSMPGLPWMWGLIVLAFLTMLFSGPIMGVSAQG